MKIYDRYVTVGIFCDCETFAKNSLAKQFRCTVSLFTISVMLNKEVLFLALLSNVIKTLVLVM